MSSSTKGQNVPAITVRLPHKSLSAHLTAQITLPALASATPSEPPSASSTGANSPIINSKELKRTPRVHDFAEYALHQAMSRLQLQEQTGIEPWYV